MAWFQKVQNAMYDALCAAFGVNPALASSLARFVPAYVEGITTPQADYNKNICYYAISSEQGTAYDYVDIRVKGSAGGPVTEIEKMIPVSVLMTFYGPDADDDAELCWSRLQVDNGYHSPRWHLRQAGIVIESINRPQTIPELEGSLWRRRADVRMRINVHDIDEIATNVVEHLPETDTIINGLGP